MSNVRIAPKVKISQILEKKKREDPVGLITAQRNGTMADFLADDLKAAGINPASVVFGGNPNLNVGGAQSISKNVKTGLTDESKPLETVNKTITHAQDVEAPKCPSCYKNVYKMDEIMFLEKEWHKDCFKCGLGNSIGCKRPLIKGDYETHANIAYCKACYASNFQLGAARGAVLNIPEATKGARSVSETASLFKSSSNEPASPSGGANKPRPTSPERFRTQIDTVKCTVCAKSVYKVEEIVALGSTWHKSCFTCGGSGDQGCKRVLTQDGFEHHSGSPYCTACFNRLFKSGAAARVAQAGQSIPSTNEDKSLHPLKSYQNMNVHVSELTSTYTETAGASTTNGTDESQGSPNRERLKSYMNLNVNIKDLKSTFAANTSDTTTAANTSPKKISSIADKFRSTSNTTKCTVCAKSVYKVEEIVALGSTWHKSCFTCGGSGDQGCKRVLTQDGFEHHSGSPYCTACFNRLFKSKTAAANKSDVANLSTEMSSMQVEESVEPVVSYAAKYGKKEEPTSPNTSFQSYTNTYEKPKPTSAAADKFKAAQAGANKCPCCTKTVYKAEEIFANGNFWHQLCFTCGGRADQGCKRRLNATNFHLQNGEPYCSTCFDRLVKAAFQRSAVGTSPRQSTSDKGSKGISADTDDSPSVPETTTTTPPSAEVASNNEMTGTMSLAERSAAFKSGSNTVAGQTYNAGSYSAEKPKTTSAVADRFKAAQAGANKCPCCTKTVYKAEEIFANGNFWHQLCFTCGGRADQGCKRRLNATNFHLQNGEPYCSTCFDRLVKEVFQKGTVVTPAGRPSEIGRPESSRSIDTSNLNLESNQSEAVNPEPWEGQTASHKLSDRNEISVATTSDSSVESSTRSTVLSGRIGVPKCIVCNMNVYKMEEIIAMDSTWHKNCFCCGGVNGTDGCKKILSADGYEVLNNVPYCYTCFLSTKKSANQSQEKNDVTTAHATHEPVHTAVMEPISTYTPAATATVTHIEQDQPTSTNEEPREEIRESFDLNQIEFHVEGLDNGDGGDDGNQAVIEPEIVPEQHMNHNNNNVVDDEVEYLAEADKEVDVEPEVEVQVEDDPAATGNETYTDVEFKGHIYRGYHLNYEYDFDENGVIYWIGTKNKTIEFSNPQLSGDMTMVMSSCYKGKVENLTSRTIQGTPTYTENSLNSWIKLDLGANRLLLADHYTIKHGGASKGNALRNWYIQAKAIDHENEEEGWITLRDHIDDQAITGEPDSTSTWQLDIPDEISDASIGFRYFRIVQHGPNANKNNCLFCCGIELYGVLFEKLE